MDAPDFEQLVTQFYEGLYRFALSLTQRETEAADLTQQTFFLWASKGHQLRDKSKVKSWLFTTLHREFLGSRRRDQKFHHHEVSSVEHELPVVAPQMVDKMDAGLVMDALLEVEELFRVPLALFYLEDHSYLEIAEIMGVPTGTVMSRLSRGKSQLREILARKVTGAGSNIVPLPHTSARQKQTL